MASRNSNGNARNSDTNANARNSDTNANARNTNSNSNALLNAIHEYLPSNVKRAILQRRVHANATRSIMNVVPQARTAVPSWSGTWGYEVISLPSEISVHFSNDAEKFYVAHNETLQTISLTSENEVHVYQANENWLTEEIWQTMIGVFLTILKRYHSDVSLPSVTVTVWRSSRPKNAPLLSKVPLLDVLDQLLQLKLQGGGGGGKRKVHVPNCGERVVHVRDNKQMVKVHGAWVPLKDALKRK